MRQNRFIFANETKIEINTFPLYHFREKTSKPSCVGIREKSSIKLFTTDLKKYGYNYKLESYLHPYLETKFSQEELAANNDSKLGSNLCTQ
ncbi:hypothetical protein BpHYR1_041751 [Brachionus plicatilis]|uniref:Uncharacterized protein n=1 Tax=Brachionus plicatilis TaxID=10195 RepID=A0A3M7RVH9_BRAPC|nr:hypothetical protein BpHYR1_041751 [Brachionus plicatilis]